MMSPVIEAREVSYGTVSGRVLQEGLTVVVRSGQLLRISGANGTGKSTLLKILLRQQATISGEVHCSVSDSELEYIPQLENTEIHLPLTLGDVLEMSRPKGVGMVSGLRYGLLHETQLNSAWNTASGGERKRTLLTRALLREPKLLVLDEPMNHLDENSRRAMVRAMADFLSRRESGRAIVMVCHQSMSSEEASEFDSIHLHLDPITKES